MKTLALASIIKTARSKRMSTEECVALIKSNYRSQAEMDTINRRLAMCEEKESILEDMVQTLATVGIPHPSVHEIERGRMN